ncbi:acetylcholine receptor subunit beta-like 1 isoform X1 [Mizuhopecten yessoensis]|uniref:Acetylcholine receptor subunit beta-like 1 n=1 Tax=Mizuhopecten yessoensis TaxID=6573 RepID=A0A210PYQ1_MIZYE|nr:acetylcholine receptor subunit beta-like 1 isoform X1 [Mizuhopecten yessoensis]OWF41617.1 Acetylcholine receptor subunit beta-like 1 [Mizuhopecten yessoensis]
MKHGGKAQQTAGSQNMWLLLMVLVQGIPTTHGLGSEDEVSLVEELFDLSNYNPLIRPVENVSQSLIVNFSLALSQIITVDEKNQIMKTNVWLQLYWYDYQLKWNPADFGDITSIRIHPEKAWRPDIVLFNNADGNYEVSYESNVVLNYTGNHYWIPPAIYKSSCTIDVQYFPFDQQECEMKFGSWTFKGDQMKFYFYRNMNTLDFTDYLKSGVWDVIDCPGRIEPGDNNTKSMVVFKFILRRKTLFYTVNLIIPCVLISFVSVCVFALPADAGEKITLCISILLALVVFLLLISKILPPSLTIPLIAKYLLFTFIMNIFAIVCTVVVINRNYRTPRTHRMPYWIRYVFLNVLPRILMMERPDHDKRWRKPEEQEQDTKLEGSSTEMHNTLPVNKPSGVLELTEIHHPNCRLNPKPTTVDYNADRDGGQIRYRMSAEVMKATEALRFITQHLEVEDEYATILDDWRYVARVMDRLLLYIFLMVTFGGTVGILLQAPHILEYVDQDEIIDQLKKKWG